MFQKLFMGRNGPDHISFVVLIVACIITFIPIPVPYGTIISLLIVAYAFYRMFSKNVVKRRSENYKFVVFWTKIKTGVSAFFSNMKRSSTHKVFACPKCGQKLRVPKGKGKINITCSNCGNKFVKKT